MKILKISNHASVSFNKIKLIAKCFAKYSGRNFKKKLDNFRSKRVDTVKIRHLVTKKAKSLLNLYMLQQ